MCMFSKEKELYYSIRFGIDLSEYTIFLAPEFYSCGKCGCIKNRGEIYHHLEECFTGFLDQNLKDSSSRIKDEFIKGRLSYVLSLYEFGFNIISYLLLFSFLLVFRLLIIGQLVIQKLILMIISLLQNIDVDSYLE